MPTITPVFSDVNLIDPVWDRRSEPQIQHRWHDHTPVPHL